MPVDKVVERAEKKRVSQSNVTFVFFDLFWSDCTAVFEDALRGALRCISENGSGGD